MPSERCAAHPGRPAVDQCPVCARPRCGADRQDDTPQASRRDGCLVCRPTGDPTPVRRRPGHLERLTRAALAAYAVALIGGGVTQQYVQAPWLEYFAPAVLGVVCAAAAVAASGHPARGRLSLQVSLVAAAMALLGVAWGVRLDGAFTPGSADASVGVPYLLAAAAAGLWATPPRPRRRSGSAEPS